MPENPLLAVKALGQSIWLDSIRRGHIASGDLARMVERDGISGETSNPAIFEKAIVGGSDYTSAIAALVAQGKSALDVYESIAVADVQAACDVFRPVYEQTEGQDGFVSLEVSPRLAYDTAGTIAEAKRLWSLVARPNVMIKIPGTSDSLPAIEHCLTEGLNINITLLFAVSVYEEVARMYVRALGARASQGKPVSRIASVASFFVSRIDTLADSRIVERKKSASPSEAAELAALEGHVAIANAKRAYKRFREIFSDPAFLALRSKGARVQRPLWASTSTKNPKYRDVVYVESLIGPDTINTLPFETIDAFRDHGTARATIESGLEEAEARLGRLETLGISLKAVTDQVLREGVEKFAEPFNKLIQTIEAKRAAATPAAAGR
jgi:transaldolase